MPTQPGDRWLLCSDGLSGVVDDAHTAKALGLGLAPGRTADNLLKQALDGGAPDNVTIVLVDVGGQHPIFSGTPTIVGSASNPIGHRGAGRPLRAAAAGCTRTGRRRTSPRHFEPAAEFLEELIEEDRRRAQAPAHRLDRRPRRRARRSSPRACSARTTGRRRATSSGADEDTVVIFQRHPAEHRADLAVDALRRHRASRSTTCPSFSRATVEQHDLGALARRRARRSSTGCARSAEATR